MSILQKLNKLKNKIDAIFDAVTRKLDKNLKKYAP